MPNLIITNNMQKYSSNKYFSNFYKSDGTSQTITNPLTIALPDTLWQTFTININKVAWDTDRITVAVTPENGASYTVVPNETEYSYKLTFTLADNPLEDINITFTEHTEVTMYPYPNWTSLGEETVMAVNMQNCYIDYSKYDTGNIVVPNDITGEHIADLWENGGDQIINAMYLVALPGYEFPLTPGSCTITLATVGTLDIVDLYNSNPPSPAAYDLYVKPGHNTPATDNNPTTAEQCRIIPLEAKTPLNKPLFLYIYMCTPTRIFFTVETPSNKAMPDYTNMAKEDLFRRADANKLKPFTYFTDLTVLTSEPKPVVTLENYGFRTFVLTSDQIQAAHDADLITDQFIINLSNFPLKMSEDLLVETTLDIDGTSTSLKCSLLNANIFEMPLFDFDVPLIDDVKELRLYLPFRQFITLDYDILKGSNIQGFIHYERFTHTVTLKIFQGDNQIYIDDYSNMLASVPVNLVNEYGKWQRQDKRTQWFNPYLSIIHGKNTPAGDIIKGELGFIDNLPIEVQDLLNTYVQKGVYYDL